MNYRSLLILLRKCRSFQQLKQIHAVSATLGLHNHQTFPCELLNCYIKLGNQQESERIFNQIRNPDVVSSTCLMNLYLKSQEPRKAFWVFSNLIRSGLRPDSYSIVGALSACGRKRDLKRGKIVHGMVFRFGLGFEPIVGNALIDMYSRNKKIEVAQMVFERTERRDIASWNSLLNGFIMCHDFKSARRVFGEMPQRNSISWAALITGYVRGKITITGLELFKQMNAEGKNCVTAIIIVAVLSGCADIGARDLGQSIHGYVNKCDFSMNVTVNNALMNMYSKSGCLNVALKIFNGMPRKDVFSWTTLISGYAFHGEGKKALEAFSDMLESRITPNEVTFVSLLSACSHAGMLADGQRLFNRMVQFYGLEPKIEHYGCMVDLLGRAGLLEESKYFIEQMPVKPDAVIWRSLLSASLFHANFNLAEMAGKMIIQLEPDDDGVYILLWNIYFAANRQEDALKIRKLMRKRKLKKNPGDSWVEVSGVIHQFIAGDKMHHAWTEIFSILEGICEQSKLDSQLLCVKLD
ncbi:Pentatricopeptide repeat-containing protein [Melia azedarach]|uniref:Pentatricopeptide repeat-containing protein n=1 Tax=Melia azedarach TaxID=155640 RepID=A0ACC1XRX6_MELAZ|nr:Pentatricopeptide repeat-containing protein [Melia azedarach]